MKTQLINKAIELGLLFNGTKLIAKKNQLKTLLSITDGNIEFDEDVNGNVIYLFEL